MFVLLYLSSNIASIERIFFFTIKSSECLFTASVLFLTIFLVIKFCFEKWYPD